MNIGLHLDPTMKKTVADLFLASAQVPAPGLENKPLSEDGLAIFRIAKEFSLTTETLETRQVDSEDLARLLRFASWLLSYGGSPAVTRRDPQSQALRSFFANIVLQAQAQFSGFEALLRSYGVDRQLDPSTIRPQQRRGPNITATESTSTPTEAGARGDSLVLGRTTRTQQIQVRVHERGTDLTSTTTESNWTAHGWRKNKP